MNNQTIKKPYGHSTMVLLGIFELVISLVSNDDIPLPPNGTFSYFFLTSPPITSFLCITQLLGLPLIAFKKIAGLALIRFYLWVINIFFIFSLIEVYNYYDNYGGYSQYPLLVVLGVIVYIPILIYWNNPSQWEYMSSLK
tara:strand:- start:1902 stop:2321 length:420 start_codon:yes stop_codon:yes gene_type:complete